MDKLNELEKEILIELGEEQYVEFLFMIGRIAKLRLRNLDIKENKKEFNMKYAPMKKKLILALYEKIKIMREKGYYGNIKINYPKETIEDLAAPPKNYS